MKIAILGSSGFIGKNLFNYFARNNAVYGLSRSISPTTTHPVDISTPRVTDVLQRCMPDIVIHAAKLNKSVDYFEEHQEEARNSEIPGVENAVSWASKNGKKVVYISTDYVYSGETNDYDESSSTRPVNFYGRLKLEAEQVTRSLPNSLILRTTVVFGNDFGGKNFLMQMLGINEPRKIPLDQVSNPTDVSVLVQYTTRALNQGLSGTFVATGPQTINRYQFAVQIAEVFNLNSSLIIPVITEDLNQSAKRPLQNGTNPKKLQEILSYRPPTLEQSLRGIRQHV